MKGDRNPYQSMIGPASIPGGFAEIPYTNKPPPTTCGVGFAGQIINNIGSDVINYKVTDPSDDPLNLRPGILRHAMSSIRGRGVHGSGSNRRAEVFMVPVPTAEPAILNC
ncbi:hypothetical protein OROGR_025821 [Orobanche gracilis]